MAEEYARGRQADGEVIACGISAHDRALRARLAPVEATVEALRAERDGLVVAEQKGMPSCHAAVGSRPGEYLLLAIKRVVAERDGIRANLAAAEA